MSDEQLVPLFSGAARSEMHRGGVVLFNATAQGYNRRSPDQNTSMKPHASQEHNLRSRGKKRSGSLVVQQLSAAAVQTVPRRCR